MPESTSLASVECEDLVNELADRMELDDDERTKFKRQCMTRAGYKAVPNYVKDKDSGKAKPGNGSKSGKPDDDDWYS